jgi:predicted ATP-dependent serine protease
VDTYYVCEKCAHWWLSPEFPDKCENCGQYHALVPCRDADVAGERSQAILDGTYGEKLPRFVG